MSIKEITSKSILDRLVELMPPELLAEKYSVTHLKNREWPFDVPKDNTETFGFNPYGGPSKSQEWQDTMIIKPMIATLQSRIENENGLVISHLLHSVKVVNFIIHAVLEPK